MTRWTNWAGNQQAAPARVVTPRSVDEVSGAVLDSVRDGLRSRMTVGGTR